MSSVTIGNYDVDTLGIIGKGGFGIVYTGKVKGTETPVAAKCVTYLEKGQVNKHLEKMGNNELAIFRQLQGHGHIVTLLDHVDDGERHWLIMEYCDLGDLPHYFSDYPPDMLAKLKVLFEASSALAYMHSFDPPIVHRDVKPSNILMVTQGNQHVAKVTDFGVGKLYESHPAVVHETMSTLAGTASFMAPEFFAPDTESLRYKCGVDMFSLGLVFHVVLDYESNRNMIPISIDAHKSNTFIHYGLEMSHAKKYNHQMPVLFDAESEVDPITVEVRTIINDMVRYDETERIKPQRVKDKITDIYCRELWNKSFQLQQKLAERDSMTIRPDEKERLKEEIMMLKAQIDLNELEVGYDGTSESEVWDDDADGWFQSWLSKMESSWRADCPVSYSMAKQLDDTTIRTTLKQYKTMATRFEEHGYKIKPVRIKGLQDLITWIKLACKAFHGHTEGLDAMKQTLEVTQKHYCNVKSHLLSHYAKFEQMVHRLPKNILEPLRARNLPGLRDNTYRVVVCGEVQSGKSSLLNLILCSETVQLLQTSKLLPVGVFYCTGRLCEVSYGDTISCSIAKDGQLQDFPFKDFEQQIQASYLFNGDNDASKTKDNINIHLPFSSLKDGLMFVDTPGIVTDSNHIQLVEEYVHQNDVAGFIVVVNAGNITLGKDLLTVLNRLATCMDKMGNRKLCAETVLFVCTFWDSVRGQDRAEFKDYLVKTLKPTGLLKEPNRQIVTINTRRALNTWEGGIISPDHDALIQGFERFLVTGQKHRLSQMHRRMMSQFDDALQLL